MFSQWWWSSGSEGGGDDSGVEIKNSLRFRGAQYLSRTQTGTSQTFTISLWCKKATSANTFLFFSDSSSPSYGTGVGFLNDDTMRFYLSSDTYSTQRYRDPGAWYHIVAVSNNGVWTAYVNGKNINVPATTGASLGNTFRIGCIADATVF